MNEQPRSGSNGRNSHLLAIAALAVSMVIWLAPASRADSLNVTLTQANQTVVLGTTTVAFDATISNPSSTDTIYLNGDSWTTSNLFLTVDDAPFFNNAPLFLDPGASSGPFELFDVLLDPNTTAGDYSLNFFSIFGGADGGAGTAFDDLVDANFSVDVTSPVVTPEPGTLLLLASGLASLAFFRKRLNSPA